MKNVNMLLIGLGLVLMSPFGLRAQPHTGPFFQPVSGSSVIATNVSFIGGNTFDTNTFYLNGGFGPASEQGVTLEGKWIWVDSVTWLTTHGGYVNASIESGNLDAHVIITNVPGTTRWNVYYDTTAQVIYFSTNFPFYFPTNGVAEYYAPLTGVVQVKYSQQSAESMVTMSPQVPSEDVHIPILGFELDTTAASPGVATSKTGTNVLNYLHTNGMWTNGYRQLLINGWYSSIGTTPITNDTTLFPGGIRPFIDYYHSNGGIVNLQFQFNTINHAWGDLTNIIQQYAADGILIDTTSSVDESFTNIQYVIEAYSYYAKLIAQTNSKPVHIYLSAQQQWAHNFQPWMATAANGWTLTQDGKVVAGEQWAWLTNQVHDAESEYPYFRPGHYHNINAVWCGGTDTNMLQAAVAMAAILPSDLHPANTNINTMMAATYNDADMLRIILDPLGFGGSLVASNGNARAWYRQLNNGEKALCLFNYSETGTSAITVDFTKLGMNVTDSANFRTVFWGTNQIVTGSITATIPAKNALLYRIVPQTVTINPLTINTVYTSPAKTGLLTINYYLTDAIGGNAVFYWTNQTSHEVFYGTNNFSLAGTVTSVMSVLIGPGETGYATKVVSGGAEAGIIGSSWRTIGQ